MRRAGFALAALLVWVALGCSSGRRASSADRQAMLVAEDRRAPTVGDMAVLRRGLESAEPATAAAALRGLGRLERPGLAPEVAAKLADPRPVVRVQAAHALAQLAQGLDSAALAQPGAVEPFARPLLERAEAERDPAVLGAVARSLGRLPYRTAELAETARQRLVTLAERSGQASLAVEATRGLEALLRLSASVLPSGAYSGDVLRRLATFHTGPADSAALVRRASWAALARVGEPRAALVRTGLADPDDQVRRLAVQAVAAASGPEDRRSLLQQALADSSAMVRLEALRAWGRHLQAQDCEPILGAIRDSNDHVALQAIDLLAHPCPELEKPAGLLRSVADALDRPSDDRGPAGWHRSARALLTLAQIAPDRIRSLLAKAAAHPIWQVRMYAARAAGFAADPVPLHALASDPNDNVREAAVMSLLQRHGHAADPVFIEQLARDDYQLVITAAGALAGTPERDRAVTALLASLARITRDRRDTSRDPRMALLARLEELGDAGRAAEIESYLRDFDPAVAERAARVMRAWTGRVASAAPRPLEVPPLSLDEIEGYRNQRLRITMSPADGGGSFEIELYPDLAPATVARVARLAREHYYDGLTFHRVVPNFVIQGGSPGANEYAGDGPYLRDEVGPVGHERGTLGISTRGRDTGDAQIFVNLVDNPRLDFNYTVWGRVVSGMAVVDALLEGAVMARVELVGGGGPSR